MSETIGLREARATLGHLVNRADIAGETTVIRRNGRPVAVVAPVPDRILIEDVEVEVSDQDGWQENAVAAWNVYVATYGFGFVQDDPREGEEDALAVMERDAWDSNGERLSGGDRYRLAVVRRESGYVIVAARLVED